MDTKEIQTNMGRITATIDPIEGTRPVVFLHGVFLNKELWKPYQSELTRRSHIYIDMPAHGDSSDVGHRWSLNDCVEMLIQVLDALQVTQCIVIGQSWGSMTALRAAVQYPNRFEALGLFNMPHKKTRGMRKWGFQMQKLFLRFPRFYATQAARSLYSDKLLQQQPELVSHMQASMARRTADELSHIIDAVILQPEDASLYIDRLKVPALAIVGEDDYVGTPTGLETWVVPGRHITPHETVEKTREAITYVLGMA